MRKMQKAKNTQKESSQTAKSEIKWGIVRMRRAEEFIASVGSPSGRWIDDVRTLAASEKSRLVARASGRYKETVRTMMRARVWTCGLHSRLDFKRVPSGPPVRPDVNIDRPDAPH
jgi:hypothetical protein